MNTTQLYLLTSGLDDPFPSRLIADCMEFWRVKPLWTDNHQTLGRDNSDDATEEPAPLPHWAEENPMNRSKHLKYLRNWIRNKRINPSLKREIINQIAFDDGMLHPTKAHENRIKFRRDYAEYVDPWMPVGEVAQ